MRLGQLHEVRQIVVVQRRLVQPLVRAPSLRRENRSHIVLVVDDLLPLAHHPETAVVDHHERDRQLVLDGDHHLLECHLRAPVAAHRHDLRFRTRQRRADRRGNAEAHRPHAAGRQEVPRQGVAEVLRRPHLVLPHVRHDQRLAVRRLVDRLDHRLRHDDVLVHRLVARRMRRAEARHLLEPVRMVRRLDARKNRRQHVFDVRDDPKIHPHVLADGRRIAVHMHDLRVLGVFRKLARHTVREARPERQQKIARGDRLVRRPFAVHARHVERERIVLVERPDAHERRRDRDVRPVRQRRQIRRRAARNDPAAREKDRPLRLVDHLRQTVELRRRRRRLRMVRPKRHALRILRRGHPALAVLGYVDDDRTRLAVRRDVERLRHDLRYLVGRMHQEVVLRDRPRDARRIRLLERVRADQRKRNLPRDENHRDAVHAGRRQPRHRVRRARTGRHQAHPRLARRPGVAVGHVRASLLVPPQNELELGGPQLVENIQNLSPRIPEEHLRARFLQRFHKCLRTRPHTRFFLHSFIRLTRWSH